MALVHDLAESVVGDLTPSCGVTREEKHAREKVSSGLQKTSQKAILRHLL